MYGKFFIVSFLFAAALAAPQQYRPAPPPPPSYKPAPPPVDESLKPYAFEYAVADAESGNDFGASESADGKAVSGSYKIKLSDGRTQTVTYSIEGESGFVADVQYEGAPVYPAYPAPAPPQPTYA